METKNYLICSCIRKIVEYATPVSVAGLQILYISIIIIMLYVLEEVVD